jgi:hypothetical protein
MALLPRPIEHVQVHVREQRRDHPALRRAGLGMEERLPLEHPGPQPCPQQLQHAPIGDPFAHQLHQDLAVERVEEAADVGVDHPAVTPQHFTLIAVSASCADRFGRNLNPNEQLRKSASKSGSKTSFAACGSQILDPSKANRLIGIVGPTTRNAPA